MTQTTQAVILLSRGGYSHAPQKQLNKVVASLQAARSDIFVLGAMVEKGEPSLPGALQQCAEAGVRHITVLPIFFPGDDNLQRWLAKVMKRWHSQWHANGVTICLAEPISEHEAMGTAVVQALQTPSVYIRNVGETPPENWATDPAGWSKLPGHSHHVIFCRGPRCTAAGADQLSTHLRERLKAYKLTDDDRVLVAQSGCLYPCNHGPLMAVYPAGVWYGDLTEVAIDRIVQEHFVEGQVVEEYVRFTSFNAGRKKNKPDCGADAPKARP